MYTHIAEHGDSYADILNKCKNLFDINVSSLSNKTNLDTIPNIVKYLYKLGIDAFNNSEYDHASLCSYYIGLLNKNVVTENMYKFFMDLYDCNTNPYCKDFNNSVNTLFNTVM